VSRAVVVALASVCVLAACSRDASPRDRPVENRAGSAPAAAPTGPAPSTAGSPASTADAGADGACVAACVKSRQMVARSIEAIEADCARTCALDAPAIAP
jgi:hypothetical protein